MIKNLRGDTVAKNQRIKKSRKKSVKATERLIDAKAKRMWIEENPDIHILNYPAKLITKRKSLKAIKMKVK